MIQVYSENNTNYSQNGDAVLLPVECETFSEIGGEWGLKIIHPLDDGGRWAYLSEEAVIKAPSYNGMQLYRIRKREKDEFEVSCECEPIFFDSMNDCFLVDVRPTNKTGQAALNAMITNAKYSGVSDIAKTSTAYYQYKNLMEALQGNDDNAFVNRWGAELAFDNFTVRAMAQLGADNGVSIRYGKNIEAIEEVVDMTAVVTRIYPEGYNGRRYSNGYVDSPLINSYPTIKTASRTYSNIMLKEDAQESAADDPANIICNTQSELNAALRNAVIAEFNAGLDRPAVTLNVDMIDLRNTEEYAEYKNLETVSLGDVVHCYHSRLGIESTERVIRIEYDAITDRVKKITLGVKEYNFFNQISGNIGSLIKTSQESQGTAAAIEAATSAASTAQSEAEAAAGAVTDLATALGSMAYQDAQGYPATYKEIIFDSVLDAWGSYIFAHEYTVTGAEVSANAWANFTSNNPTFNALDDGVYVCIMQVAVSGAASDGEFTIRAWNHGAEVDDTGQRTRVSAPIKAGARTAATAVFVWDASGTTFTGWPQIYSSVNVTPRSARITLIRIGGSA